MAEPAAPKTAEDELLRMTAEVVSAYVSNNTLGTAQLADVSRLLGHASARQDAPARLRPPGARTNH